MRHFTATALAGALLIATSGMAAAQSRAVLPVVNVGSGKVESFLQLDPVRSTAGTQWRLGTRGLDTAFGLGDGQSLALLCNPNGLASMQAMSRECVLGSLGNNGKYNLGASVKSGGNRLGLNIGQGNGGLPDWLSPGARDRNLQQTDMALFAERAIGRTGVVSIAGTTANARLVPATSLPILADRWNTQSLSVGGGLGAVRANVFGRVVNVPGQPRFEGYGLGVTWRTPWSGQLSVGAENIVTKGSNPFAAPRKGANPQDSTVPYVRYQQDL